MAQASTAAPPLDWKLRPAGPRAEPVVRERLLRALDRVGAHGLTLVVAPVGFGKTTLVESWAARAEAAVAWVSLDPGDNDPVRLWTYIAAAIDRLRSGLGRPALARLQTPGVPTEVVVDDLANAVDTYDGQIAIVLDDLHLVTDESCMRSLAHAVEQLPPHVRLIVTTRSDPPLPFARLRALGMLGEIRAHELAFSFEEARELLVEREGIPLDDDGVGLLVDRTEGWPAGLYLAALWLRELTDPAEGVRTFQATHRHVADYLTTEVLDTLDVDTRRFLLESSVLGSFCGDLCDDVLDRGDSTQRLHELALTNGFLIPLDTRGEWYRYHHLFGELLALELTALEPDEPARLHARASAWCRERGLVDDALEHAAAAGAPRLVAETLYVAQRELLLTGRLATVLRWCLSLPEELLLELPDLPLGGALAAGLSGDRTPARRRLLAVAARSRSERPESWKPRDEAAFGLTRSFWVDSSLRASIELARSTVDLARQAPEFAVPALACLSYLLYLVGAHDEARALAREAVDRPEAPERPHGLVMALATASLVEAESGRAERAEERAREAIATATDAGIDRTASGGAARVALAVALAAQGKLRIAEREAATAETLRRQYEPEAAHLHALLVLADIQARCGKLERAASTLEQARSQLTTFSDAGRLPELALAVEQLLESRRVGASVVSEEPSAAELGVLRLLASDLSQREIGSRLYVSRNTVKTHTRAIYRKLGVTSRKEAVERATALGWLDPDDSPG